MLSIVIPTYNELKNNYIQKSFSQLSQLTNTEVIVVDYNSDDGTKELALSYDFKVISCDEHSRAKRLNLGIKNSSGLFVLLHHPRSLIDSEGLDYIVKNIKTLPAWSVFTHKFDQSHPLLKFTSFWSNYMRGDRRGIFYLDHCFVINKNLLEKINYVPEVDIFEDTLLSLKLKKTAHPHRLKFYATTSAIRFTKNGIYKQSFLNQKLKWKYYFGTSDKHMNEDYETGLELNSRYQQKDK